MADNYIVRDFSIAHDFRRILWKETIWYNLLRAAGAGCVIGVLMLLFGEDADSRLQGLSAPLIWPAAYMIVMLPLGVVTAKLAWSSGWVALFARFVSLIAVAIGDPLVCLLHRFAPNLVPLQEPPLFSTQIIMFVLKPDTTVVAAGDNRLVA